MLIAQLFLVVSITVATADVIADSPVQNSPAEFQAVNCGGKVCKNGAKCKNGTTCECPNGTKGNECEVVIGCAKLKEKCDRINTECIYEPNSWTATCKCEKENTGFNGESCVDCNCGAFGTSCLFSDQGKYCFCKKGYSSKFGKCLQCSCGAFEEMCLFNDKGKFCTCKKGSIFKSGTCLECTCGPQTITCGYGTGKKYCVCEDGYEFKLGTCEKCACGENSTGCHFSDKGIKSCHCTDGSEDKLGTCTHCDCGPDTICKFTNTGEKDCVCVGESCREPDTPWYKNPIVIVCIVFVVASVVGISSFVAYRKLSSNR